ncbi:MAG: tetratricopeptide repeat protein [Arenimonas sp.]
MSDLLQRIDRLKSYLAADPANAMLICDLVDAYFAAAQYQEADQLLSSLGAGLIDEPGVAFRRARISLILGRYEDSISALQALIDQGHENVALWHDLAFSYLCLKNTSSATWAISEAVKRFGDNAELSIVAGRIALMDGDFETAHAQLVKALSLAPEHATAMGLQALVYLDSDKQDIAFDVAKNCLSLYPDQHEALLVIGTVSLWRQDLSTASECFTRVLERHPNSGRARTGYGQVKMMQNKLLEAREQLRMAVIAIPEHIGTWHALAWTQLLLGDVDAAEASYQSGYDLDRNFADSHGGLALIHALKGRTEEADQAIKRALRLNPACVTAHYARTLLLSDAGQIHEADSQLADLLQQTKLPLNIDVREFAKNLRARFGQKAV